MATTIGTITLDGSFTDWLAAQPLTNSPNTVAGYQVYGALINDATLGENYVIGIDATDSTNDQPIVAGTVIYLNTDQNDSTGYSPPFAPLGVGAEYQIKFLDDLTGALQAYLYSADGTSPLNGGLPLNSGFSTNGESVELAIPQSLLTPTGGTAPTAINFDVLINNATGLPTPFSTTTPQYVIPDPAAAPPPTTIGTITLDGTFTDWPAADSVMTSGNTVAGYQVYGAFLSNTYVIGIDATNPADPVIGAGSTIYLNTDQNPATGYELSFANVGAEYEVQFSYGPNSELEPFLYSVTAGGTGNPILLNNGQPLPFGMSSNGESVELAIPQSLLTPAGGAAPTSINFAALINNTNGMPSDLANNPEYIITDSAALVPVDHTIKKVGIVYSATTAALYFGGGPAGESAYSDLFMAAQQQARAAGVSYDMLTEADLTDVAKLSQYSALIFPDFQNVQSSQVSGIANALHQVVYEYHVPIITAGDFMTNDQTGTPLPGTFANMQDLLNLTSAGFNNSATYSVTPDPTALANNNPILAGYTSGQLIGGASGEFANTTRGIYTATGYLTFAGVTQPATTLADINTLNPDGSVSSVLPGVVQTTTGGTNTEFATTGLFGDSNLLQQVIQNTVFGTTPSLAMDITRFKGIVNSRTDMDQSQFPDDVSPTNDSGQRLPGIYDQMMPILASLNQQYDFVGSYYINIGDNANPADNSSTNWTISTPYYDQLLQMGNEIGTHSYTHLIDPPTTTVLETTEGDTPAGSTQVKVSALPSYNGATLGMTVTGTNIGPNTIVTAVSGDATSGYTLTLQYLPGGFGTPNLGVTGDVPAGSTLTFGVPTENTNFLSTTGTGPFTYNYEFTQSKQIEDANLGITIAGAAVPGANDYLPDSQQILSDFPTANGLTGYVSGGWTGVGSGSPNAFGYITPSDSKSVYIAPDITFDFSEIGFEGKTPESALADWESLFNQLSSNSDTPVIVWPWHDYGITDWPTNGPGTAPPGYDQTLYQNFIAFAFGADYEFVTSEDLASRIAAEQAAKLSETTSGNVITATVTPDPTQPDLGAMALNVVNGATGQIIQNAGSWYAYDSNSVFMPYGGGTFTVTLGATQDDVTHIDSLPMRADLQSVTGNGSNLTFAMTGDGTVDIHIKTPGAGNNVISIQTSAVGTGAGVPTATLNGDDLQLTFNDGPLAFNTTSPEGIPVLHNVTITEGPTAVAGAIIFAAPTVAFTSAGGQTNVPGQTISGTVTEPTESQVVGTTVTLYDNGSTTPLATATVQADGSWKTATPVTLSDGVHSIVASDTDLSNLTGSSSPLVYTVDTQTPAVAIIGAGGVTSSASQTIMGTVTEPVETEVAGTTVTLYDNLSTTPLGTAVVGADGSWLTTVTLTPGPNSIVAKDTDLAGNLGASSPVVYTLGVAAPVVSDLPNPVNASYDAGFTVNAGAAVSVTVNGGSPLTAAQLAADFAMTTNGILDTYTALPNAFVGTEAIAVSATLTVGSIVSLPGTLTLKPIDTTAPTQPAITTISFGSSHWTLAGMAVAGSTVTIYDGITKLGTVVANATTGAWTFPTTEANTAIRIYTVTATDAAGNASVPSAAYYEGTAGADTFNIASEAALSAAALINGGNGNDTLLLTAAATLTDADFAHIQSIEILGLTGTSTVILGPNAVTAGIKTVNAAGIGSGNVLTLVGPNALAVTNLTGNLDATLDTGPLTIIATGPTTQSVTLGSGLTTITDSSTTGNVVVDATAYGTQLLTIAGNTAPKTVSKLAGNLLVTGNGPVTVTSATGAGSQMVTPGTGNTTITDNNASAIMTVNANAMGGGQTLTLAGSAAEIVTNLAAIVAASGLSGTLNVTTKAGSATITTGTGPATINAGATTGTLTLMGAKTPTATSVTAGGNVTATGDSNDLTVTLTGVTPSGATRRVITGSGNISITDSSTSSSVTINGAAQTSNSTATVMGANPVIVNNLKGNLNAAGDSGAITITANGTTTQNVTLGSGLTTINSAAGSNIVVDAAKALATNTLALSGAGPKTVNNVTGNVSVTGGGAVTVTATGTGAQKVTTGSGATSISDNSGSMTVDANAMGGGQTLTLNGGAPEIVNNLAAIVAASGLSGTLNVTTKAGSATITTGTGATTINAGATTGTLTLKGGAATVTALGGNLNAAGDSGTLTVTTNGSAPTVTTGSGNITITDNSTGTLTVNDALLGSGSTATVTLGSGPASLANTSTPGKFVVDATAMLATNTLTLSGAGAKTVNSLQGNLSWTSGAGPITVTATGSGPQSITTGTGADTILDQTSGGDTIHGGGGADSINVTGHTGADSFTYSATSDSLNTAGHDLITGFMPSAKDLLDFSNVNPGTLNIQGLISSGTSGTVNADSIGWLFVGGSAMVYENNTNRALATNNTSLMEITLAGVSSLSASNFHA